MSAHDLESTFIRIMSKTTYFDDEGNETTLKTVDQRDWTGDFPIHVAVMAKDLDATRTLISNGAKVNATGENDMTALHCAALVNFSEVVSELIAHGADLNAKNSAGQTALHIAKSLGHLEVERQLGERLQKR